MLLAALLCLLPALSTQTGAPQGESAAAEFRRIGDELYANKNPYVGSTLRKAMERSLAEDQLPEEKRIEGMILLGKEYMKCAELDAAIRTFEQVMEIGKSKEGADPKQSAVLQFRMHRNLALAYLRQAEQKNCVARHNAECCLFPLEGGAVHVEREPALKAREHYLALLEREPDDAEVVWLLNVTAMALGEYPDGVPERWRIPEKALASQAEFPRFHDVAARVGTDVVNMAGGVAVEDFDGDGWLDVLTSTCDPLGPLTYLHNRGDGTFEDRSKAARTEEQLGGLNLVSGDYDNDGDFDAVVLRGAWLMDYGRIRRSLLRNDAADDAAVFTDVTKAAGLAEPAYPGQSGVFADFDSDGWLDFYAAHESRNEWEPGAPEYPCQLYRSRRDGTFENTTARAGVANVRYAKGCTVGDYDQDGDVDLFVSNIGVNRLYRNAGDGTFEDVAERAGVGGKKQRHFACWFFDVDEDGWLDLWVNGFQTQLQDLANHALGRPESALRAMLLVNRHDGTFTDRALAAGLDFPCLPMGSNFGDLDNDGWLDVYLGTGEPSLQALMPNVLLWNRGGERFLDVTRAAGMGHLQKGHGVAFADLDHDGDQDVLHQLGGFYLVDRFASALFENPGFGNHWLSVELAGTATNRCAIGARVRVVVETPRGPRELHRTVGSVSSFGGSPHRQEIGLGDATKVNALEIRWPRTKEPQVFTEVPLDAFVRVTEGKAELERLARAPAARVPSGDAKER